MSVWEEVVVLPAKQMFTDRIGFPIHVLLKQPVRTPLAPWKGYHGFGKGVQM